MYCPKPFAEDDPAVLHRLVRQHPLGLLVTSGAAGLDANALPFWLDTAASPVGTLQAHVARANPLWRDVADGAPVLVVFRGAQGYISPSWYPGKHERHRRVPTWHYEVVQAHGTLHVRDDGPFVRDIVARLTREHEAREPRPWSLDEAPPDYLARMLASIVGLEIRVERWEGKRKLGQQHTRADREGAIHALEARGQHGLAVAMRQALEAAS